MLPKPLHRWWGSSCCTNPGKKPRVFCLCGKKKRFWHRFSRRLFGAFKNQFSKGFWFWGWTIYREMHPNQPNLGEACIGLPELFFFEIVSHRGRSLAFVFVGTSLDISWYLRVNLWNIISSTQWIPWNSKGIVCHYTSGVRLCPIIHTKYLTGIWWWRFLWEDLRDLVPG